MVGWLCQSWGTPDLALFGSYSSGFGIENRFFFLLSHSFRNFLTKSGIFYQPAKLVGNRFNRFSTIVDWLCQSWGIPDLVLFGSHSSRIGIENRFFCLLPYSFRNFLTKFGIFYQPSEPVGNRFSTIAGCLCQPWGTPAFLCLVLTYSASELRTVSFFCFLNQLETFWPNLGFFINRMNRFSTIAGCLCQPWGTPAFLCPVLTHPSSELRTASFFVFLNHLGTPWPN